MSTSETKESTPLVCVICDVFNHGAYLRDCLNGLTNQETNFDYTILIHDDASTDSSPHIIKEYEERYPNLFKTIFQKNNQYSQGIGIWKTYQFPRIQTKYVAFCEGDDYWIDSMKLQKEVDFLESHSECSAVFGNIIVRDETVNPITETPSKQLARFFKLEDVLSGTLFPVASICVRRMVIDNWDNSIRSNGDMILAYTAASLGNVYMLNDCMSVYRRTGKGVCTSKDRSQQLIAELKEWYNFHKQLQFPKPLTLIHYQSKVIVRYICNMGLHHFPFKDILKHLRTKYVLIYVYYINKLLIKHIYNIFTTR